MLIWSLAKKEFRLLLRDRISAVILVAMPLLFILLLGLLLGEGFGQKPDNRVRVSLVDLDLGYQPLGAAGWFALLPGEGWASSVASAMAFQHFLEQQEPWSKVVERDLSDTAEIRLEFIDTREQAKRLVDRGDRAAVLVFEPGFSTHVHICSFLADGINPFFRDGINLREIDAELLKDPAQLTSSAVIDQVGQVSLLRVVLPWMIGKAFERMSDPEFIDKLGEKVRLPVPPQFKPLVKLLLKPKPDDPNRDRITLQEMLDLAAGTDRHAAAEYRQKVGAGVQQALAAQFPRYNLLGKTWASLTKSDPRLGSGAATSRYVEEGGSGLLRRGAARYQILVPAYTVMFAFSLVLTVGWLFVLERRQGTMTRLRAAPLTRTQILLGKFVPCFGVSLAQGLILLLIGRLVFGMRWGPESWSLTRQVFTLLPVAACTSLAAIGISMFLAAIARTEIQVALVGSLLVLMLGLLSGCLIPRELLPDSMLAVSRFTPNAWALDAYRQLLVSPTPGVEPVPNLALVAQACGVLAAFGGGFLALAWWLLRLE
jgi:ABC-type multidrug transport system permease subunit